MTGIEIVIAIFLFWGMALVTLKVFESLKNSSNSKTLLDSLNRRLDATAQSLKEDDLKIWEKYWELELKVNKITSEFDVVFKLADETKKLLNQNTISNAFVHKNKRTELT